MQLRPFTETDYPALARAYARVYPAAPRSEAELRYADGRYTPPYQHARWVAVVEESGELIGWAEFAQAASSYQPHKFQLEVAALKDAQVKAALYEQLLSALKPFHPTLLKTEVEEADSPFYLARGFREVKKNWTLHLSLENFSETLYSEKGSPLGCEFVSFAELERTDAGTRALYELLRELVTAVPSTEPRSPWSFEQFLQHRKNSPVLLPEGSLVVRRGEHLVGLSELKRTPDPLQLMTSLTAVKRAFRAQGLALAVKLRTLQRARELGFRGVYTQNASSNARMMALNEALGFTKQRATVELVKDEGLA